MRRRVAASRASRQVSPDAYAHLDRRSNMSSKRCSRCGFSHSPIFRDARLNNTPSSTLAMRGLTLQPIRPRGPRLFRLIAPSEDTGGRSLAISDHASALSSVNGRTLGYTRWCTSSASSCIATRIARDISLLDERAPSVVCRIQCHCGRVSDRTDPRITDAMRGTPRGHCRRRGGTCAGYAEPQPACEPTGASPH
jgi:hypothetical protein